MNKKRNNKGFTLVELIVVMAIMAILIGALAPQVIKYVEKSRESKDLQVLNTVFTAAQTSLASSEDSLESIESETLADFLEATYGAEALDILIGEIAVPSGSTKEVKAAEEIEAKLTSKKGKDNNIYISYDATTNKITVATKESATGDNLLTVTN